VIKIKPKDDDRNDQINCKKGGDFIGEKFLDYEGEI
jgi:hypothetical protein